MTAIKAGILTPTTKAELDRAEAERAEFMKALKANASGIEQAPSVLPHAVDRYRDLIADLETVTLGDVGRARTQIKALLGGKIQLIPQDDGYLEAELAGDYAGLV